MLKQNTQSTIIVVLSQLKLPYEMVHKGCRNLYFICCQNIVKTSVKRLEIIPFLKEKNAKLNNNKILTYSIVFFSNFKLHFVFSFKDVLKLYRKFQMCSTNLYNLLQTYFVLLFSHKSNLIQLKFSLVFNLVSFFLPFLFC